MKISIKSFLFTLIILSGISVHLAQADSLAITHVTIIDGTGAQPVDDGAILIEDGKISFSGPRQNLNIPPDTQTIKASDKFVIPGLMDANLHLFLNRDLETLIKYEDRFDEIVVEAAQITLKAGQTTVFDTWGPLPALIKARDKINNGELPGSRIYLAGNIIGYGGIFSTDFNAAAADHLSKAFVKRMNATWEQNTGQHLLWSTPDQVREAVREYATLGVDLLKYGASGHELHEMRFISFSPRVQKIIVEEGHRAGLTVQAHTSTTESLDMALEAGVDIITHCGVSGMDTPLALETIQKMADLKIPCSVLPITQRRLDAMLEVDPNHWLSRFTQIIKANHKNMIKAGVTMLVATDGGIRNPVLTAEASGLAAVQVDSRTALGEGLFNALVGLQEMGMEPMEILKAVTSNTANAYQMGETLGTLEAGKAADLVILDENPLADAAHYRRINMVIKSGNVVDLEALPLAPLISSMQVETEAENR